MTFLVILFAAILVAAVVWAANARREDRRAEIPWREDASGADVVFLTDPSGSSLDAPHHGGCDSGGHDAGGGDSGCHSGFDGGHHG
jgi:hypothetical protein